MLDTHTLLWALAAPYRLSQEARVRIEDPNVRLFVSTASAWEIATKHRLGKLEAADPLVYALGAHIERLGAEVLPIGLEHALLAGRFEHPHRDPFDRMLAAQSLLENLPIVSRDGALSGLGAARVW